MSEEMLKLARGMIELPAEPADRRVLADAYIKLESRNKLLESVLNAAEALQCDISRTINMSIDWSYTPGYEESFSSSTVVDNNNLMALVNAIRAARGEDE